MSDNPMSRRSAEGSEGQDPNAGLARDFAELARTMATESDLAGVLYRVTSAAVLEIDGADYAGITLIEGREIQTEAASDEVVTLVDREQCRLQQGPCLEALRRERTVRTDDLHAEPRWPDFAAAALSLGIESMLAVQLFVNGKSLGALNIYSTTPNAFNDDDESTAMLLAAHAAVAMQATNDKVHLRTALESRDLIGQAKGVLMERHKIDSKQAFDLLVYASQRRQIKLRTIAEQLTITGELT